MNYLYHYKQLIKSRKKLQEIRKRQRKNKSHYFEEHHIILKSFLISKPKSVWNGKWNRVLLSAREHFLAHKLLWKACNQIYGEEHPYTIKCMYSVLNFTKRRASNRANYKINARTYEELKLRYSKNHSFIQLGEKNHFYGKTHSKETRDLQGNPKRKNYMIKFIDGNVIKINGMKKWCRLNRYNSSLMFQVASGKRKKYRDIIEVKKI